MKPYRFCRIAKISLLAGALELLGIQSGSPHHKSNPSSTSAQSAANQAAATATATTIDVATTTTSAVAALTTTASASLMTAASVNGTSSSFLANVIANDAGGHPDQYSYYAERLALTLSQLSTDQRSRVFSH